ncbi:MAG TPA: TIGR01210 family radical SAM protein, partial [Archaeoglobaceae archaeon]|nr:TIGR01210 family radical SAM protein [Archaeoglobaceae archaeon]
SRMKEIPVDFKTEVGIGLETANDFIRENCINKGFTFEDFVRASNILRKHGVRVKVYLLLKPPFLSENEAIKDVISSAKAVKKYADVISLNLTNIPSGTYIEMLWKKRLYRPPWLWSAVEAMKIVRKTGVEIISDPVAAGKQRSVHNCGKCDYEVTNAIKRFSLTQNEEEFDNLYCKCIELWKRVIEIEDFSRIPLVK